jgi:hypothetical protein
MRRQRDRAEYRVRGRVDQSQPAVAECHHSQAVSCVDVNIVCVVAQRDVGNWRNVGGGE